MQKSGKVIRILISVLYPVLIFLAAMFLVEVIYTVGFILIKIGYAGMSALSEDYQGILTEAADSISRNSLYITLIRSVLLIPVFLLLMRTDQKKERKNGLYVTFTPICKAWFILLPFVGFCAAVGFNQVVAITGLKEISKTYQQVEAAVYSGSIGLEILTTAIAAPVVEELLFRGLVYRRLRRHLKPVWSAFASSALFGLLHGNIVQFVYAFLLGAILSWVYEKFKTVAAPIIFHAGANLIAVLITEFVPGWGGNLSVGTFMLLTVVELAITFLLLWLMDQKIDRQPIMKENMREQ